MFASVDDDNSFDLIEFLLDGLQGLFVPSNDFLQDWQESISQKFESRFAGVTNALGYMKDRFSQLREYNGLNSTFDVRFPSNSFLSGISMNPLTAGRDVYSWIRFCLTGFCVVATALACYHKVSRMVNK